MNFYLKTQTNKPEKEILNGNRVMSNDKNNNSLPQAAFQMPNTKTTKFSELMDRTRKKSFSKHTGEINGYSHNGPSQIETIPKKTFLR